MSSTSQRILKQWNNDIKTILIHNITLFGSHTEQWCDSSSHIVVTGKKNSEFLTPQANYATVQMNEILSGKQL